MRRSPGFWLATGAATLVAFAVAAGLVAIGSPGTARLERLDVRRVEDLRAIERATGGTWQREGMPPASLDTVYAQRIGRAPTDPETGEPYEYRVLSDSTAALCATFALARNEREDAPDMHFIPDAHPAGRHCFTLHPPRSP